MKKKRSEWKEKFISVSGSEKASYLCRILLLLLCVVGLSYAWFHMKNYEGGAIEYEKDLMIASSGGHVTNYIGTVNGKDSTDITYTELKSDLKVTWSSDGKLKQEEVTENGGFLAENLYPGGRIYFKTVIENTKEIPIELSVYLTGVEYSAALNQAIHFVETQPGSYSKCYEDQAKETEQDGERICTLSSARITENIEIPAAKGIGEERVSGKTEVYWYIEISGEEAGNECENSWIMINQMQLLTSSKE